MSTLVTRSGKGSPLTHNEVDTNFTNLNTDKVEKTAADITGGTINNTTIGATTPSTGVFTDASVTTASGQSAFNENDTITGWIYSGNSFSVAGQETSPTGLFIGSNGTKMYVCGSAGDDVNEYTLSTAWDITTGSFVTTFSTAAQDTAPQDIFFKPDGLSMFVMGSTNDTVFQYTLSTAWDVSTASYASKSFSVTSQEATPLGLWFKPDGLVMYVVGSTSDTVFQYTLGTAWDVSTASYGGIFYSVAAQEAGPVQVNLSADGTKMWVLGSTGDDILEYTLGTAWNVSTATPVNNFYIGFQETTSQGLFIDSTASNRVYVMGSGTDAVYQYYTAANSLKLDTQNLYVDGALSINENFVVGQNAYVDGALTVQGVGSFGSLSVGTLSNNSTINLTGSTTSTTSLGTAATTGTLFLGGTAQTGTITLGQSTVSQTTNIQAGATASGSTKTINIGTGGVSGSTTAINIGSAVSGSLGTTTISAPTVNIGQLATQFSVTNTASAVNYVQVTGAATGAPSQPIISAQGSDANINIAIQGKGTGAAVLLDSGGGSTLQAIPRATGGDTFLSVQRNVGAVVLSAASGVSNGNLVLQPKGTGALQAQQTDSTATGGNARGANAVDWQTTRASASQVASATASNISGGANNTNSGTYSFVGSGFQNRSLANGAGVVTGSSNTASQQYALVGAGISNTASGWFNFIGNGFTNSGTANAAVTTQSGTMNATTAVTLSGSNANIKVGQYITGTSIASDTYVAAISGTSLTLSQAASGSSTSTLSFFTPHGVVVGGGNNQATGSYSFIGGGGDAGTAANRNVASGDWSFVGGGVKNTASGLGAAVVGGGVFSSGSYFANTASGTSSFVGGGTNNTASGGYSAITGGLSNVASGTGTFIGASDSSTASGAYSSILSGQRAITRGIIGNAVFGAGAPISLNVGAGQAALLILNRQTTDATPTVLTSETNGPSTTNQVILPNNSAYYFKGSVIANVTGAANGAAWSIEGAIMRGANAASTVLIDTPSVNRVAASSGASAWVVAVTADTTNGGLAVTVTGAASTTIRWVCKAETTEVTF